MEAVCKVNQSTGLEKTITVVRGNASLGAISKDGRLKVGDGILALNEEATINLTTAQARAMLRKHSLIGPELSVTYVPAAFLDMHRAIQSKQDVKASRATVIQSKQALKLNQATVIQSENNIKLGQATVIRLKEGMNSGQADVVQTKKEMNLSQATVIQLKQGTTIGCSTAAQGHKTPATTVTQLKCIPEQSKEEGGRAIEKTCWKREKGQAENMTRLRCSDHEERKEKQQKGARDRDPLLSLQAEGWRKDETEKETEEKRHRSDEQTWSHPRRVTLIRTNRESLGISVIGGRGMGCRLSNGEMRRGIFIKHITENSPAARDNTLTAGDRIIQGVHSFSHIFLVYLDHMLQKYGSLPDELKLVKLDCSTRRPGLGVCVPTALQPDGADEQIRVRDEQFEVRA
ncbi:Multiple PDZ domain protein [Bagarius yarrelli]|uniref:Multiple PDZ domain protein n=1 Tax=Bagarius yarrelli TaxID=175774 RepID=A0A556UFZ9_BAGYA|nr:Multiple PDZ domain protein [Bagarius yarrelli]